MTEEQVKEIIKRMFKNQEIKLYTTLERDTVYNRLEAKIEIFIDGECIQEDKCTIYMEYN